MNGNRKFLMLYYTYTISSPLFTAIEGQPPSNPIYIKKNNSKRAWFFDSLPYDLYHTGTGDYMAFYVSDHPGI